MALIGFDKYIFLWSLFNLQVFAVVAYIAGDLRGLAKYCMNMTFIFWRIILLARSGSTLKSLILKGVSNFSTNQTACTFLGKFQTKSLIWYNKNIWRPTDTVFQKFKSFLNTFLYKYYLLEIWPNLIMQFAYLFRESDIF